MDSPKSPGSVATNIDREALLRWKAGMEEMNRNALEEARRRTPAERLRNLQAFLDGHANIGMIRTSSEDRAHRIPYHEIRERWIARHT